MNRRDKRRQMTLTIAVLLAVVIGLFPQALPGVETPTASAHNLQTRMVYMFLDQPSQALLDTRIAGAWTPGNPILQVNDEIGLVIKVVPQDGTTTGVGGHVDFYVPNGVTVVDAAYVIPDGSGGFVETAMKGQSPIAIGSGPIGAKVTSQLTGMTPIGPNINGVTSDPVVAASGLHRGTIAGVYGDTGIFYSTDPDTAYGSWQDYSNASNPTERERCGLVGTFPLGGAKTITNNSGDTFVPCNKWDAEQMFAWGAKGTTYPGGTTSPNGASSPVVDYADGRGNAPWGFASGVAGPQSGYAWFFDWDEWKASSKTATDMKAAMDTMGPWQRVSYPGSRISYDQPGLASTTIGFASVNGDDVGVNLKTGDLVPTVSQTDGTSPKTIRWAVGQLTEYRPEYVWVKLKIDNPTSGAGGFLNADGCPVFHGDTFGGDAGGTDNGKDHLWRYYEPSKVTWNGCLAAGKPADAQFVPSNGIFSYKIKVYNLGSTTQTNVVVKDTLPSGIQFISASPPQNSGPNPLIWNVGTLAPNSKFEATLTVKATGSGYLDNCLLVTSNQGTTSACETTVGGSVPYLVPGKSVTPQTISPGGTVQYTIEVKNIGSGPSSSPTTLNEMLETGFTYVSKDSVMVNGVDYTASTSVNNSNPNAPVFTIPAGINAGKSLILKFTAMVGANLQPGSYCNTYSLVSNGIPLTTGSLACVQVGGGQIGDFVWRDWNGDGVQDAGEEGIAGVAVELYNDVNGDGDYDVGTDTFVTSTTTDASGNYLFTGLPAGNYVVVVPTPPAGSTNTGNPPGGGGDPTNQGAATIVNPTDQVLTVDFGYQPTGSATIGDTVFADNNQDGLFDGGDTGIDGVTVRLYEDTNGDGIIDSGDLEIDSTTTAGGGDYSFTGLNPNFSYLVAVDDGPGSPIDTYFAFPYVLSTTANPYQVTPAIFTAQSDAVTTADFGYFGLDPAAIGDQVFVDNNDNGIFDAGDTPLANVTVSLYDSTGTTLLDTTTSALDGTYSFTGLAPGTYVVRVDPNDPDVPTNLAPSISEYTGVTLTAGQINNDIDFPFVSILTKSVDKASADPGDILNYTINPRYTGNQMLSSITVADTIPAGTTYVGDSDTPEAVSEPANGGTGTITWDLGSNAAGTPGTHPGSAGGGTVNAPAAADSWLNDDATSTNYGSATTMRLDSAGGDEGKGRPVIRFDLSSIPTGATVTAATLKLTVVANSNTGARTIRVYPLTQSFVESQVTWNVRSTGNNWASSGGSFGAELANTSVTGNAEYSWSSASLTSQVQGWITTPANNFGFLLGDIATGTVTKDFATKENATTSAHPVLEITYTGGPSGPATTTTLVTSRSLVGNGDQFKVTMTLATTSAGTVTGVTASNSLTVNGTNGFTASCGTPTLTSADSTISNTSDPVTYEYSCTANTASLTAVPASVTFTGGATATGATFNDGTSNSVLAAPQLTFQVTVSGPPATVDLVENTAYIADASVIPSTPSNTTQTALNGSIGDYVWADTDGDGVQDPGEFGLPGVAVCVYESDGTTLVGCDTTDSAGAYRVFGLTSGDYVVRTTPATYPAGYIPSTAQTLNVTLSSGQQYDDADFGLRPPGTGKIGDYIWLDANDDGVQDAAEAGLPNIGVTLEIFVGGNWSVVTTTTTDADGLYEFTGLDAGQYRVTVDTTSTVTSPYDPAFTSTLGAAMDPTYDKDGTTVSPNGVTEVTLATSSTVVNDVDFGYKWGGSIGDYLWYDTNGDGVQDGGEPPVTTDAVIDLYYDTNGNGQVDPGEPILAVTFVDGSGFYSFDNLPPGDYVVKAEEQTVLAPPSSPNAGDPGRMVTTTGSEHGVMLAEGQNYTAADFGFIEGAELAGTVFHDVNHNGVLDPGEPGLPSVTVNLTGTDFAGNPVNLTTTTDANGEYEFIVPPGNYTVSYVTTDPDIPSDLSDETTPTSATFVVPAGAEIDGIDFGRDNPGKIGDFIWNDTNGNGVQNAGEPGIGGVTVDLYLDADGNPATTGDQTLVASTVTTGAGFYQFLGLPDTTGAQAYVAKVVPATLPAGYIATGEGDPGLPCASLPGGVCDNQIATTLTGGATISNVDFGYTPGPTSFPVSGTVWNDTDGNGTQNGGEPGIPGVEVCLEDSDGNIVACTTTDSNGDYTFPGVPNGSYTIVVDPDTLPNDAYVQTGDPNAVCPSAGCDDQSPIVVNGAPVTNQNFGYQEQLGSLAGTVCDGDGDGLCGGGDSPLPGVLVFLTWAGPDGILGTADDVVTTDTTDINGDYSFTNLLPGVYSITKVSPPGYSSLADADGGNPNYISVNLLPGQNKVDQDFEVDPLAGSIGDRVWLDIDGDGVQDAGEPGLANVVVELKDGSGNPIDSDPNTPGVQPTLQTTDMNGNYLFTDVPAGNYQVDVISGLPANVVESPGTTDPRSVTLASGQSYLDADFGYTAPPTKAIIGDFVWADVDADGIQDPGEAGLGGVTLYLCTVTTSPCNSGNAVATAITDPDGSYLFTNVDPGKYVVQVDTSTLPGGSTVTTGPQSQGSNTSSPISATAGAVITTIDFGYDVPTLYPISDRVWYDANRDGILDGGEAGIGGVTVNLLDNGGNVIATTTTNPDGTFTFPGVPDGNYTIQIADNFGVLTDLQPTTPNATTGTRPVTVAGAPVTGTNFGYAGLGPIGDTVWSDANNNGVQDPGEPGIPGVDVELYLDDGDGIFEPGGDDVLIGAQTTDGSGTYLFNDLPEGAFWVSVDNTQTALSGYTLTTPDASPGGPNSAEFLVTLTPTSPSYLDADYGYQKPSLADVSGTVWNDTNSDGVQDPTEPGIPGVTVCLEASDGTIAACTTSDGSGNYTFPDVPPGDYTVVVTDDDSVLNDYTLTSGLDEIPITVAGTDITDVDFGYVRNPTTGAIGDTVWHDANRDGVQNGAEPGIADVTVKLYKDDDGTPGPSGGDTLVDTTTTDINGQYLFNGLLTGDYYVDVDQTTLPAGLAPTTGTTDPSAVVNLSPGEVYLDVDFGYASQTGSAIGDRIWYDVDGDGLQDPGEPGIGGVTVTVTGPSCLGGCTVVTDPDGSWLVPGLTPGDYVVTVTPPAGYDPMPTNFPSVLLTFPVPAGQDVLYADFGFTNNPGATGSLGDTIFFDANGNGAQDGGEPGIAGVTLSLFDNGGNLVASTETDANGTYSFPGLPTGANYTVVVTDVQNVLAGLRQTGDPDEAGTCITCDNQGAGAVSDNTLDFGYAPAGGTIGNQVWHDVNGDGVRTADEPGMQGVTIDLYLDVNGDGVLTPGLDNLIRTTASDVNGQYNFVGLPAGKYLVDVTDKAGVLAGFDKTSGTAGVDDNSQADPYPVTLTAGNLQNFTADFGYTAPPGQEYTISGTTFEDLNNNGGTVPHPESGEPPLAGVTVYLYRDLNGNGVIDPGDPVIGTDVTDSNGDYEFTDLPPGNYIVSNDALSTRGNGYFQTTQNATKPVQPVTIVAANVVDQDFGYHAAQVIPTAVILADFTAAAQTDHILVAWETVSELDNAGFNLYRSATDAAPEQLLANIASQSPGSAQGAFYSYQDLAVEAGQVYYYWLETVDLNGSTELHGPVNATMLIPTAVTLNNVEADSGATTNLLWLLVVAVGLALAAVYGLRRSAAR